MIVPMAVNGIFLYSKFQTKNMASTIYINIVMMGWQKLVPNISRANIKSRFLVASYDNPHNICEYARRQNFPYGNIDIPDIRDCPGLPANFAKNPYDADVIESERINNYNVYPTAGFTPKTGVCTDILIIAW